MVKHEPKACEFCGELFEPTYNVSRALFAKRQFCSVGCSGKAKRGVPRPDIAGPRRPLADQFWDKLEGADSDQCWEWRGARFVQGYGKINRLGIFLRAHRVSWELHNGPIPEGLDVLHHCDNPPCVNPAHLYVGTDRDNARDRERRGRGNQLRGEGFHAAKVTDAQVAEIRKRVAAGETQTAVADDYGIKQAHVSRIVRGLAR